MDEKHGKKSEMFRNYLQLARSLFCRGGPTGLALVHQKPYFPCPDAFWHIYNVGVFNFLMYCGFQLPDCPGDDSKRTWNDSCGIMTNRGQTACGHTGDGVTLSLSSIWQGWAGGTK